MTEEVASTAKRDEWGALIVHKFHAQITQSPPVTMLHTLTCPVCAAAGDECRVVRARNVAEAVLDLLEAYMSANVRRNVCVCSCTKGRTPAVD
jgi:hypothetical protein